MKWYVTFDEVTRGYPSRRQLGFLSVPSRSLWVVTSLRFRRSGVTAKGSHWNSEDWDTGHRERMLGGSGLVTDPRAACGP